MFENVLSISFCFGCNSIEEFLVVLVIREEQHSVKLRICQKIAPVRPWIGGTFGDAAIYSWSRKRGDRQPFVAMCDVWHVEQPEDNVTLKVAGHSSIESVPFSNLQMKPLFNQNKMWRRYELSLWSLMKITSQNLKRRERDSFLCGTIAISWLHITCVTWLPLCRDTRNSNHVFWGLFFQKGEFLISEMSVPCSTQICQKCSFFASADFDAIRYANFKPSSQSPQSRVSVIHSRCGTNHIFFILITKEKKMIFQVLPWTWSPLVLVIPDFYLLVHSG